MQSEILTLVVFDGIGCDIASIVTRGGVCGLCLGRSGLNAIAYLPLDQTVGLASASSYCSGWRK